MGISMDGLSILRAILDHPKAFPDVSADITKAAQAIVTSQLKAQSTTLDIVRDIHRVIGNSALALVVDSLPDTVAKSLAKKLDKENPALSKGSPEWHRNQIMTLAGGAVEPTKKTTAPARTTTKTPRTAKRPTFTQEEASAAKDLKAKSAKLDKARILWLDLGQASFRTVLASLTQIQTVDLAKRLDKDNTNIATATTDWLREHIVSLASGQADPVYKSILESKARSATRVRATRAE